MTDKAPKRAMVLAAGLGLRMRPITDTMPKPLVEVAGRTLLDRGLDVLAAAGVERAVVNVHHFGDQVARHVAGRASPRIVISDESARLLDSAGGIVKALSQLGAEPFYILNADTFWLEPQGHNLADLAAAWNDGRMDILLLLADPDRATGHTGATDFLVDDDGRLRRAAGAREGMIYAGAAIVHPRIFADAPTEPHSLNRYFDTAIAGGRLYGHPMRGHWITVGTPDAIALAEAAIAEAAAETS